MKLKLGSFFSPFLSLFWILYLAAQLVVWHYPLRSVLFGLSASVELISNFMNDMIWLPLAVFLPVYLAYLFAKTTSPIVAKIVIYVVGLALPVIGFLYITVYFKYLIYLILLLAAFLLYHIFQKSRLRMHVYFFALAIVLFVTHYGSTLLPKISLSDHSTNSLSIMTYNIWDNSDFGNREQTTDFIKSQNADIVAVQEISTGDRKILRQMMQDVYPYQLWADRYENYNGGVIFSKFPFVESQNINIKATETRQHTNMNYAVIEFSGQNIHIFNTHLHHGATPFIGFLVGVKTLDAYLHESGQGYTYHNEEARLVINRVMQANGPIILTGDFNDTPNSYVYFHYLKYLNNAFAKAGWGLGTTFGYKTLENNIPPKLQRFLFDFIRIDHIFCSNDFDVKSAKVIYVPHSDHRPQTARLELRD